MSCHFLGESEMNLTLFEISAAIVMLVVAIGLVLWIRSYMAAESERRMITMMKRVGLEPGNVARDDPRAEALMKEVRGRCQKCQSEDKCERWFAGEVEGENSFCPNARVFDLLKGTASPAA